MTYEYTHETTYAYRESTSISHHLLHLQPRHFPGQACFDFQLAVNPPPKNLSRFIDYFGNATDLITLEKPHRELVIRSSGKVQRTASRVPVPAETPSWESVRDLARGCQIGASLEASEFLFDSPLIVTNDDFFNYARASFPKNRPILEAVLNLTERIHTDFTFDQGVTNVTTPVEVILANRRGVCQDFAHLQIACLRSLGLPARYVSGYIETLPPPGGEKLIGADASHAWVSFYTHGLGWMDVDPTNNQLVSLQHLTLAWGRDYSDVSPVRGVILGNGQHSVKVAVDVEQSTREMPLNQP